MIVECCYEGMQFVFTFGLHFWASCLGVEIVLVIWLSINVQRKLRAENLFKFIALSFFIFADSS